MATIYVRGREIDVQAKVGTQRNALIRKYEGYSDARLDQLERESNEHRLYTKDQVRKRKTSRR